MNASMLSQTAMPLRAAIYARFSSDRQDARSISDQVALCRDYARRQGWRVAEVYSDAAISGASVQGREGLARLIADSELRLFDVVLAADLDRLSRDIADMETLRAGMELSGIAIHSVADGPVTKVHTGIKGLMGSLFLDALKAHTRRGMAGKVREGRAGGGKLYGYTTGAQKGDRVIVPEEAGVVLRIFQEYDAGRSPRAIAERLNAENIRPPSGTDWNASTINGNRSRHYGILINPLYDGRLVWNRVSMRKRPTATSGCRGRTRQRSGSRLGSSICGSCRPTCSRGCRPPKRSAARPAPNARAGPGICSLDYCAAAAAAPRWRSPTSIMRTAAFPADGARKAAVAPTAGPTSSPRSNSGCSPASRRSSKIPAPSSATLRPIAPKGGAWRPAPR